MNALRQIGTIRVPARSRCVVCRQVGVEFALEEDGRVGLYHRFCFKRRFGKPVIVSDPPVRSGQKEGERWK